MKLYTVNGIRIVTILGLILLVTMGVFSIRSFLIVYYNSCGISHTNEVLVQIYKVDLHTLKQEWVLPTLQLTLLGKWRTV